MKSELSSLNPRDFLDYNTETGVFTWKVNRRPGIKPGDAAGTINSHGYSQICFKGGIYLAHRVAWFFVHGYWPTKMIDHIDGVRSNNRISNLREASGAQNQANRGARKDSKTGERGVRFHGSSNTYSACIQVGGFKSLEEAKEAHAALAQFCYGEFAPTPAATAALKARRQESRNA